MKKVILSMLILVLSLSLFFGVTVVNAEESIKVGDLRQIDENTTFHNAEDFSIADIRLPATYWVQVVGEKNSYYLFQYNGVKLALSKEKTQMLNKYKYSDVIPTTFSAPVLKVEFNEDELPIPDIPLYADKECSPKSSDIITRLTNGTTIIFLNQFTLSENKVVYLVSTENNKIGYIPAKFTNIKTGITIPSWQAPDEPDPKPLPNPDDTVVPDTGTGGSESIIKPNENTQVEPTKNNVVKIVLIVSICILAAALVFLLFKPTRNKKSGRYSVDDYDDYERDDSYQDRY